MGKRILFSPVGGTDPIRYLRDGSMLHICRVYQPDVVYMYLSHEMMEHHRHDNRYVYSVEQLGKMLNHEFEIHLIERDEMIDVQQYDVFYRDFREVIRKIEKEMAADDELIINMASGTPAMKSALLVMATLAEYRFLPIQVSTPLKRLNAESEDRDNYDVEVNWELNEDNTDSFENRCQEVRCFNLMKLLKLDMIKKHLGAYDYTAAKTVADEIRDEISEEAYHLIEIAAERVKLNRNKISQLMQGHSYDIFPVREGNKQKIFEYALVLQMKLQKEEYTDFIRGITPIVTDLLEAVLERQCNLKVSDCCTIRNKVMYWDLSKLSEHELLEVLDDEYSNKGGFKPGPVYSNVLAALIRRRCSDLVLIQKVNEISQAEIAVRNVAAHEIVSVTDEWFTEQAGKSAKEIFANIRFLMGKAGINVREDQWKSYDQMNQFIIQMLEK
jgi:CRISPR type III-A/MTUBE-associated protein Csm6